MNKQVVIKLLKNQTITEIEFNEFIADYVKHKKGNDATVEQLNDIKQLINSGLFNLGFAVREAARDLNLQITTVADKLGQIIRIDVTE